MSSSKYILLNVFLTRRYLISYPTRHSDTGYIDAWAMSLLFQVGLVKLAFLLHGLTEDGRFNHFYFYTIYNIEIINIFIPAKRSKVSILTLLTSQLVFRHS